MTSYVSTRQLSASSVSNHFSNIWRSHISDLDYCQMTNLCLIPSNLSAPPLSVHQSILLPLCPMLGDLVEKDSSSQPTLIFPDVSLSVLQGLLTLVYRGYCNLNNECTLDDIQSLVHSLGMVISNLTQQNQHPTQLQNSSDPFWVFIPTVSHGNNNKVSGIRPVFPRKSLARYAKSSPSNKHATPGENCGLTKLRVKPSFIPSKLCDNDLVKQEINHNHPSSAILSSPLSPQFDVTGSDGKSDQVPHCLGPRSGLKGDHGLNFGMRASRLSIMNPENSCRCEDCGKLCLSSVHLMFHTDVEHQAGGDPNIKCRFCSFVVKKNRKSDLLDHLQNTHTEFLCCLCEETFTFIENKTRPGNRFLEHNKEKHQGQAMVNLTPVTPVKQEHACTECHFSSPSLAKLYFHSATRHGEPGSDSYKCQFCSYSRIKSGRGGSGPLLEHLVVHHTGEKNYVCTFCGQEFAARKTLVNHEKLHTGEKNHKCGMCDAKFVQLTALKSHIRVHLKSK